MKKNFISQLFFLMVIIGQSVLSGKSYAAVGFQLGTGGLTPHFTSRKNNYCNQWNNTGVIVNKTYYMSLLLGDLALSYMQGNDSICSEIEGVFMHYYMKRTQLIDLGLTIGGYVYNKQNWIEHAQKTPSDISAPAPVTVELDGREICPILALDVEIHLIRRSDWSLKLNNLLTPVITNHSVAFEYRFN